MTSYLVSDYTVGRAADDLAAYLNSIGAQGWCLNDVDMTHQTQRRAIFIQASGMIEYLIVDYDTGQTADVLEADLDNYGATGWELKAVDMLHQTRRRAILMKASSTPQQTFFYRFDTDTAPSRLQSGEVMFSNSDATLATDIYICTITDGGTDISSFLATLKVGDQIYIQDKSDSTAYFRFHLTALPSGPMAQPPYVDLPVAWDASGTNAIGNRQEVIVSLGTDTPISGGGGGGIPDAPTDSTTYGRYNATWNRALAYSNDTLDGGDF